MRWLNSVEMLCDMRVLRETECAMQRANNGVRKGEWAQGKTGARCAGRGDSRERMDSCLLVVILN